jgi:uncharacterized protein YciI
MPTYAVTYTYADDSLAPRDELRPAHREYLVAQPELRAGSAYQDDGPAGALLIYAADGTDRIRDLVEGDPFFTAGLISAWTVREWTPALGSVAASLR